jgi:hypothetical protein
VYIKKKDSTGEKGKRKERKGIGRGNERKVVRETNFPTVEWCRVVAGVVVVRPDELR